MRTRIAALGLGLLLLGCSSPNPRYYSLETQSGRPVHSPARTITVRGVPVARYLERNEIVRSLQGGRIRVSDDDWWGEPLRNMLQRVLAADLAQRLPDAQVLGTQALGGEGATVLLAVERFEPGSDGAVILDGHLAIQVGGRDQLLRRIAITVTVPGSGMSGQISAMSQALGQVADIAAVALAKDAATAITGGSQR